MGEVIRYFVGNKPMVMINDKPYTAEEVKHIDKVNYANGYNDRMAGYYDKWYRYNSYDNGRAYDLGVQAATLNPDCEEECYIIECN